MLRTAIIGISGYGREHLRLLLRGHKLRNLQAVAAVVINPEDEVENIEVLQSLGCKIFSNTESMWKELSGSIDLCMIPTPIPMHYVFTKEALSNGSHVFVEKPLTGSLEEANELIELSKQKNLKICVGFQDLYNPTNIEIKDIILSGVLGELKIIKGWGSWPRPVSYFERANWVGKKQLNGSWVLDSPLNNAMAHFLMLMLYWAGESLASTATVKHIKAELYRAQDIENFDTATLLIETKNGPPVYYGVTHSAEELHQPSLKIIGTKGTIEWVHGGPVKITTPSINKTIPYRDLDEVREFMMDQVVEFIEEYNGLVVEAHQVLPHVEVITALNEKFQILDFKKALLKKKVTSDPDKDVFIHLPQLAQMIRQGFDNELLLSAVPDFNDRIINKTKDAEVLTPLNHFYESAPKEATS